MQAVSTFHCTRMSKGEDRKKIAQNWIFPWFPVFGLIFSCFRSGTYFRTYLVSYFGPKARKLFSSRLGRLDRKLKEASDIFKRAFLSIYWGTPPVRLGLSGRHSGKIPERPRKRSQSFFWNSPRELGWDPPSPTIQGIWRLRSISRILPPPPQYVWGCFFFSEP